MAHEKRAFGGMATKYNIKCADGLTLCQGAFDDCDGKRVPLLWNHQHNNPEALMGYAILHKQPDGVYSDCYLNDSPFANATRLALQHGDVWSLSIFANKLKKIGREVVHGVIREVSVVLAGANPEALIDLNSVAHSGMAMSEDERVEFIDKDVDGFEAYIYHSDVDDDGYTVPSKIDVVEEEAEDEEESEEEPEMNKEQIEQVVEEEEVEHGGMEEKKDERTVQDVYNEMTDEQKKVVQFMVGMAAQGEKKDSEGGKDTMEHGYSAYEDNESLQHSILDKETQAEILSGMETFGSLKAAIKKFEAENELEHSALGEAINETVEDSLQHGINNIGTFFPDAKLVRKEPDFIDRRQDWVQKVLGGAKKFPWGKIKSWHADITKDEARAKGYVTGNMKMEEFIDNMERETTPQTIYKKQSLDRDYILDITDFNVVSWLRGEMRGKLDEEVARAILIGDGRASGVADKIKETNIRPIWTDSAPYVVNAVETHASNADADAVTRARLETIVRNRKNFFGTGTPTFFTTEDFLTDCLLLKDSIGHYLYENVEKLKTFLRVSDIVTVPVMANKTRTVVIDSTSHTRTLVGIIVNMNDYACGSDKGGNVSIFDDFDIDLNKEKYLIETRMSGAMITPRAAMVLESEVSGN